MNSTMDKRTQERLYRNGVKVRNPDCTCLWSPVHGRLMCKHCERNPPMTLREFADQVKRDADNFVPYIEKLNRENPEAACVDTDEADWFEQFCMYVESINREG